MLTQCCECERSGFRFWGTAVYCARHIDMARRVDPDAHSCEQCGEEQGRMVHWERRRPCADCQEKGVATKTENESSHVEIDLPSVLVARIALLERIANEAERTAQFANVLQDSIKELRALGKK